MKTTHVLTAITIVVLLCTGACGIAQCHMGGSSHNHSNNSTSTASSAGVSASSAAETIIYTCPMHPEVTSDKPGKCPKCGMDLVIKEQQTVSEKKDIVMYECPMKCDGKSYTASGKCPVCGMDLVKQSPVMTESKLKKDSVYYGCCPMCPEIKMDKPGKCPKCGMELVKKTVTISDTKSEKKETEHKHKEGEGHIH